MTFHAGRATVNAWTHSAPSILAALLASLVEFVEALTIVLAVGIVRGWRPALVGTAAGAMLLAVIVDAPETADSIEA